MVGMLEFCGEPPLGKFPVVLVPVLDGTLLVKLWVNTRRLLCRVGEWSLLLWPRMKLLWKVRTIRWLCACNC